MPNPRLYAGQVILADKWNSLIAKVVQQENDQVMTSSITPVATEIVFTPEPNATYQYSLFISYSATTASGIRWQWLAPGATFCSFSQAISSPGAGTTTNSPQSVNFRRAANVTGRLAGGSDTASPPTGFHSAYDQGTFTTDGTINPVTLQWAQAVLHANQSILRGGNQTRFLYTRIA